MNSLQGGSAFGTARTIADAASNENPIDIHRGNGRDWRMQTLSRRSFLHASVGLLALPALAAPEENLTLGFSLYGMKTLKTGDALLRLSSIGYD